MRTLALILFLTITALPAYGQAGSTDFFVVTRALDAPSEVVQARATALAATNDYLDATAPAGDPTALLPGDVRLRIDGAPFTLSLHATSRRTEVKLESRRLDLESATKKKAEAFVQELAESITANRG